MQSLQEIIDNHGKIVAPKTYKTSISFDFDPKYLTYNESKFAFNRNKDIQIDRYGNEKIHIILYITLKKNDGRRQTI
jgi:hypothetical protein